MISSLPVLQSVSFESGSSLWVPLIISEEPLQSHSRLIIDLEISNSYLSCRRLKQRSLLAEVFSLYVCLSYNYNTFITRTTWKKTQQKKSACKLFSIYIVQREIISAQLYTVLEELRFSSQNCANPVTFILYSPIPSSLPSGLYCAKCQCRKDRTTTLKNRDILEEKTRVF